MTQEILGQKELDFLQKYLDNHSPTGFEAEGQKLWVDYIRPFVDTWELDDYGTAFGIVNPGKDFKVVVEGHADEISWFVNYIGDDGYIQVIRNGGSDHIIAPSMRVVLHGKNGLVPGVFGWPALHTRIGKDENLAPTIENIFIDLGVSSKDEVLALGIEIGTVVTYTDGFMRIGENYIAGRALDNRIGGFCIAQVARLLKENQISLPFSLYFVNAVQEEIGLRGAEMIAHRIKPNAAIITDVTHDTRSPLMNPKAKGDIKCGLGPTITTAPAVHRVLYNLLDKTAQENSIPLQKEASSRSTGTDTDAFAYSNEGVPSALISLPLKYMHTTVEMAHIKDIENLIKLIYYAVQKIEYKHNFKYF